MLFMPLLYQELVVLLRGVCIGGAVAVLGLAAAVQQVAGLTQQDTPPPWALQKTVGYGYEIWLFGHGGWLHSYYQIGQLRSEGARVTVEIGDGWLAVPLRFTTDGRPGLKACRQRLEELPGQLAICQQWLRKQRLLLP